MASIFTKPIIDKCVEAFIELDSLPLSDRIDIINSIKLELRKHSPFANEPVDCVLWVRLNEVQANDYNPNSVAPPEMKLLAHSISEDGYTQPIVTWKNGDTYEVVDGYHRNRVGREIPDVKNRVHGHLPVTVVNVARTDRGDRIAATIRHNRARGKHRIDSMSEIVVELKRRNWSDEKIGRELGMDADEVLRLAQITGLAEMFASRDFSQAWEAEESSEINISDNLETHEENLPSLPVVGGLAGGNVSGDTKRNPPKRNRRSGKTVKNARSAQKGNEESRGNMADSNTSKPKQCRTKPTSLAGAVSLLSGNDNARLPYQTRMAHTHRGPAGRSKRNSRFRD